MPPGIENFNSDFNAPVRLPDHQPSNPRDAVGIARLMSLRQALSCETRSVDVLEKSKSARNVA
jgi:hypothetical protein